MRGWVYVIANRAMPGLVKVGFSTKDPQARAQEIENEGIPHAFSVEFDVLVRDPRKVEQAAHSLLHDYAEGKEWFRCSVGVAESAVRLAAEGAVCAPSQSNGLAAPESSGAATDRSWSSPEVRAAFIEEVLRLYEERAENNQRYDQLMKTYAWCPICRTKVTRLGEQTQFTCPKCAKPFSQ